MNGFGSGESGEFTFLDLVALTSFSIGLRNLDMNLTQDDKQDLMNGLSSQSRNLLKEIHSHLEEQDRKIDLIMEALNVRDKETRGSDR